MQDSRMFQFHELNQKQKEQHILSLCSKHGLDVSTNPFVVIKMQGREALAITKNGADQLRQKYNVSVKIEKIQETQEMIFVRVSAKMPMANGLIREDEDFGCVPITSHISPQEFCNRRMKAVTIAKKRVTVSITGLSTLSKEEAESVVSEQATTARAEQSAFHQSISNAKREGLKNDVF